MMPCNGEYFRELCSLLRGDMLVMLRVYADESGTGGTGTPVLCGFVDAAENWGRFVKRWGAVLKEYNAPHFHFREFVDKDNRYKIPNNPFLKWSEKKRDNFFYDLALTACGTAVPLGGLVNIPKLQELGNTDNPFARAMGVFYHSFSITMASHWPCYDGKVAFVFDRNENIEKWAGPLTAIHNEKASKDNKIGALAFDDDKECLPLQAADLLANSMRQQGEKFWKWKGERQKVRLLDFILMQSSNPENHSHPGRINLLKKVVRHYKIQKVLWVKAGNPKKQYYPYEHFPFEKHGFTFR